MRPSRRPPSAERLSPILLIVGMIIAGMGSALGIKIVLLGVFLYCGVLVFQVINLPVEFDASAGPSGFCGNTRSSMAREPSPSIAS